jgi:predicted transcriptional regulator with HTH domain
MKLSQENRDKIASQILAYLYQSFPKSLFTAEIAKEFTTL